MLQCDALCCSVWQCVAVCVAVCCSVLQCVAECRGASCCSDFNVRLCIDSDAVCCSVLQRVAVWCSVLQRTAVRCKMCGCVLTRKFFGVVGTLPFLKSCEKVAIPARARSFRCLLLSVGDSLCVAIVALVQLEGNGPDSSQCTTARHTLVDTHIKRERETHTHTHTTRTTSAVSPPFMLCCYCQCGACQWLRILLTATHTL